MAARVARGGHVVAPRVCASAIRGFGNLDRAFCKMVFLEMVFQDGVDGGTQ